MPSLLTGSPYGFGPLAGGLPGLLRGRNPIFVRPAGRDSEHRVSGT
jgi:hypothetical protein